MNKQQLGRIFVIFGLATLLASIVDIAIVLIPLHLSDSNWVYLSSQDLADRSVIPLLGLIIILAGLYLNNDQKSRLKLNSEKCLGIFSFIFGLGLILITVFYTLTLSSIETQVSQSLKQKGENVKKQIVISYLQQQGIKPTSEKLAIPKELEKYFKEIDKKVAAELKIEKKSLLKKNIKTVLNLILFAFAYLYIGINVFSATCTNLKQLNLKNNSTT